MLQVKVKFRLKILNLGWFSIFFVLPAQIIHELGLGNTEFFLKPEFNFDI